jgi:hypothetical protein
MMLLLVFLNLKGLCLKPQAKRSSIPEHYKRRFYSIRKAQKEQMTKRVFHASREWDRVLLWHRLEMIL